MSTQDPLINQVLGGARLEQRVSKGLMADVYRGQYERLNVPVAVKVLSPKAMAQGVNKERFLREGRALAQLQHPNIIKIYNVGHEQNRYFIIMDWIQDGVNLRQLAQTHPLTPAQSLKVIQRLCDAMEYIHGKSLVHRDVKPANICLRRGGHPVLMDFSLIKDQSSDVQLTAPGTIMGTVNFMPPEQAQPGGAFGDVSVRSDVYSLGGTLYWLLTGKPPFKGRTPMETIIKLMREEALPPSTHNPTLPKIVDQLVLETLSKRQETRPSSPRDLGNRIEEVFRNYRAELEAAQRPALAADDSGRHKSASQEGSGSRAPAASSSAGGRPLPPRASDVAPVPSSSAAWGAVGPASPSAPLQHAPHQAHQVPHHPAAMPHAAMAPAARGPAPMAAPGMMQPGMQPRPVPPPARVPSAVGPQYPQPAPMPSPAAPSALVSGGAPAAWELAPPPRAPGLGVAEPPGSAKTSSKLHALGGPQPQQPPAPTLEPALPLGDGGLRPLDIDVQAGEDADPHELGAAPFAPSLSTEGAAAGLLRMPAELPQQPWQGADQRGESDDKEDGDEEEEAPRRAAQRSQRSRGGRGNNALVIAALLLVTTGSLSVFVLIFFFNWDPFAR